MGKLHFSLASFLSLVAAGLIVPFILFIIFLASQLEEREEADLRYRSQGSAVSIASSVDRNLRDMTTALRILTTSPLLRQGDMAALHGRFQVAVGKSAWNLIAVDSQGNQLLNTRVPFGTPLGKTSNMAALSTALEGDRSFVSDVFFGNTSQRWVFNIIQPVPDRGPTGVAALILTQNADELTGLLDAAPLPSQWTAAIVDQGGRLVATSRPSNALIGEELPLGLRISLASSGTEMANLRGEPIVVSHALMVGFRWQAVVWGPVSTGQISIFGGWRTLFLGALVISVVSGLFLYLLVSRLRSAIHGLSAMALSIGAGNVVPPIRTGIHELNNVANSLSVASFDRSQSEEKLLLVTRELVHRTKNLLALVQSMIRQSARRHKSAEDLVPGLTNRLAGLAQSIDLLTAQSWEGVSLRELIRVQLFPFGAGSDRLTTNGPDLLLKPEAVQNFGLILHELATNAVKHGSLSTVSGRVEISWRDTTGDPPKFVLRWEELGGSQRKTAKSRQGFGTTIIERHAAAAFAGQVRFEIRQNGVLWELTTRRGALEWDGGQKFVTASTQQNTRQDH